MNCKPGDLAWIVRVGPRTQRLLGRMVKVISLDHSTVAPAWEYEGALMEDGGRWKLAFLEDCCLKPHRPGDLHETEGDRKEVTA